MPATLGGLVKALRRPQDHEVFERVLRHCEGLISRADAGLGAHVTDLARALLYADAPEEFMRGGGGGLEGARYPCLEGAASELVDAIH